MKTNTLIRRVYMECPLCDKTHEIEERKRVVTITIKGKEISYEESYYFCANADEEENEFVNGAMLNSNLLYAKNALKLKHNKI